MTQPEPENGVSNLAGLADEMKRESVRLRQLAEQLDARQKALSEMEATYPHLLRFVYAKLREESLKTELPTLDLEELARLEEAQPLEAFIHKIEGTAGEP